MISNLYLYLPLFVTFLYITSPLLVTLLYKLKCITFYQKFTQRLLWLYCSLVPTLVLIQIRLESKFSIYHLIILLPIIIQFLSINKLLKATGNSEWSIKSINSTFHTSKLMEYFVTLILPFITLSNEVKDKYTISLVLIIIILVFSKLKIYYFNLPILLFYNIHEVTLNNNEVYYLITKRKEINLNENYRITAYDKGFKIALLHSHSK